MHTEGHDMGKDTAGNTRPANPVGKFDADHPGYETSDVNVNGISVFLAGLFGTVIIFFFFCYGMGKVINNMWIKQDGGASKWAVERGVTLPGGKREDLASNAEMKQRELQQMTNVFPEPRLDIDDGNQATADLHAREDLLLENYSLVDGKSGTIRIPIERAMELIAQRGLPLAQSSATPDNVAYATREPIKTPLTTGFARTGFELQTIEARKQRMEYGKAEGESTHAELNAPR
jgi:hypothetical protein